MDDFSPAAPKNLTGEALINLLVQICIKSQIRGMYYLGCQSGVWARLLLRYLPELRIVGAEANPFVFVQNHRKLTSIENFSYINVALSNRCGISTLYLPPLEPTFVPKNRLDGTLFSSFHTQSVDFREGWRTDATLDYRLLSSPINRKIEVPTVCFEEFIQKNPLPRPTLLLSDIQGMELDVLTPFKANLSNFVDIAFLEIYPIDPLSGPPHQIPSLMTLNGFSYFANDKLDLHPECYNDLYLGTEILSKNAWLENMEIQMDDSINASNLEKPYLASRLGKSPFRGIILRLLTFFGMKIY